MQLTRGLQRRMWTYARKIFTVSDQIAEGKILAAKILINQIAARNTLPDIQDAEFRVFSQFGEDGIIQYLIRAANVPKELQTFVEFGVETYEESNTRFLLINNNWRGLVIDGSPSNIALIKESPIYWRYGLTAVAAFINVENINRLISGAGFGGEVGILSIDIDGNDYWVWDRINVVNPIVVVAEYNSVFGPRHAVSVPYDPGFLRDKAHYSNLYWGCSLKALELLGEKKGYALVGSNSAGNNAFFVRRDCLHGLKPLKSAEAYVESQFRESRDPDGRLTYLSGSDRLKAINQLPICQVDRGVVLGIGELFK